MLGLTVPVSRLRSPTSQLQPIGLLLQAQGCNPLIHWGKPQHETAELGATSKPTPARRLSRGPLQSRRESSPSQGDGFQSLRSKLTIDMVNLVKVRDCLSTTAT
ncbi:hypothetical protein CRENBAI_022736 [Crenichthys baileyi]|uniref:Uncharacterized protein n=1 Tax=Crenichthys baileyi TaxID=28760 RepID=A0AAV9S9U9_9TELE